MADNKNPSQSTDNRPDDPKWKLMEEDGRVIVSEGQAKISFPSNQVFYNPIQEFNRDMSIAAINVWSTMFFQERVQRQGQKSKQRSQKKPQTADKDVKVKLEPGTTEETGTSAPSAGNDVPMPQAKPSKPLLRGKGDNSKQSRAARRKEARAAGLPDSATSPLRWMDTFEEGEMKDLEEPDMNSNEYKNQRFNVLEALSATGLRSIRYAKELKYVSKIVANDISPQAVEAIRKNAEENEVQDKVTPSTGDASFVMYKALALGEKFDVIDLDPYGSAAPFIDAAVQAVSDGGLLCVTCTDLAVLAGNHPESCWTKYGGMPVPNTPYCHEMALRIVLHTLSTSASRYRRYIVPLASFSIDFYVRLFVRVYTSPSISKKASGKTGMVYSCVGCKSFEVQQLGKSGEGDKFGPIAGPAVNQACAHCGKKSHLGGPFWSAPIHDRRYLARMINHVKEAGGQHYGTHTRMLGMLTVAFEELPVPFYWGLSALSGAIHCSSPPLVTVHSALLNLGYKVSVSHACAPSLKTNAPSAAVWDVMRKWVEKHPVKVKADQKDNLEIPSVAILAKARTHDIDFTKHPGADPPSRKFKLVRYQENPTKNWGPMSRAAPKSDKKKQPKRGDKRKVEGGEESHDGMSREEKKIKVEA